MWNRICIFLAFIFNFYFNLYVFSSGKVVLQKRQVIVTSLGCRCRHSVRWGGAGGAPQSPDCGIFCNVRGKKGEGEMEDDRGMAMEFESMISIQNLGGRQMLRFMRAGISVCVVVVLVVGMVFFGECSL